MTTFQDVGVIGAGPYGLSVAAHLIAKGARVTVFGSVMQTWREAMPEDMFLKSEGFASSLSDPRRSYPLKAFCRERDIAYADVNVPVTAKTFIAYGEAFQKRFVPDVDARHVRRLRQIPGGFELELEDGQTVAARRVVVASGIRPYAWIPPELATAPSAVLTHSAQYGDITPLRDKHVIVIGAGATAMDLAALLTRRGSRVTIIARRERVWFQTPLGLRSLWDRIRAPMTGLGPGWKSVLCVKAPFVFAMMPKAFRIEVVRRYLGPAPSWFSRKDVEGKLPLVTGVTILGVASDNGAAVVTVRTKDGQRTLTADHVIAATGYRVDVARLPFLDGALRDKIKRTDAAPALSLGFESSVPGLYFVGTNAANTFGPLLRFVHGTDFAARHLARCLSGALSPRRREPMASAPRPARA